MLTMTREDALIELMHAHQRGIWRYLRFLGADVALADDITQETFIAAFEKPFEERGHAATAAYLRLAARNLFLNVLRREKRQLPFDVEEAERAWLRVAGQIGPEFDTDGDDTIGDTERGQTAEDVNGGGWTMERM